MRTLRFFSFILLWVVQTPAFAQVLDDTTEMVYGPHTTFYTTYDRIKHNDYSLSNVDTAIGELHEYTWVEASRRKFQNLGNIGTAMEPVFFTPDVNFGAKTGFNAYAPFHINPEDVKYYDSKSPYSKINAVFGGQRRNVTEVNLTRNVNPFWNVGFFYRRIGTEKQIGSSGRNDRQTVATAYYFHSHYISQNGKFALMGYFARNKHEVEESGGVKTDSTMVLPDYFDDNTANPNLQNAESMDFRLSSHLYTHYKLDELIQVYYDFYYAQYRNFFDDIPLRSGANSGDIEFYEQFYGPILINPDSTSRSAKFTEINNEGGIKGDIGDFHYNFYLKYRYLDFFQNHLPGTNVDDELYAGFYLDYDIGKTRKLKAEGSYVTGNAYRFHANYKGKFLEASYTRSSSKPGYIFNRHYSNHHFWENSFNNVDADQLKGRIIFPLGKQKIAPKLTLSNVVNNIYLDNEITPQQTGGAVQILSPGLDVHFQVGKFHLEGEGIYTQLTGDSEAINTFRIPEIFVNGRLYYYNILFDGKLEVQIGVEGHYKTDYYAKAYDPVLQQFYLQDEFVIPEYLLLDAYVNFRIDSFDAFIKFENISQPPNGGYFTTPYYPGTPGFISLGIGWMFFD